MPTAFRLLLEGANSSPDKVDGLLDGSEEEMRSAVNPDNGEDLVASAEEAESR